MDAWDTLNTIICRLLPCCPPTPVWTGLKRSVTTHIYVSLSGLTLESNRMLHLLCINSDPWLEVLSKILTYMYVQYVWCIAMGFHFSQRDVFNYHLKLCSIKFFFFQWKEVFAERYKLCNNWLKGRCNVRTFEGHTQGECILPPFWLFLLLILVKSVWFFFSFCRNFLCAVWWYQDC